jgi:hypothetical protein
MANYNKSFNFRNGVQVDDDNFIVNANGLVGIGTSIPTEILDVRGGNIKCDSAIISNSLIINGIGIVTNLRGTVINSGITSITSGIISATVGVITYYGDGGNLLNLPTSQWTDVNSGLGFTSIYSQGFVGIATNDPRFTFQVGGKYSDILSAPNGFLSGVGINSTGDIFCTGFVNAGNFVGSGIGIVEINASNISSGTLNNNRLPTNLIVVGSVTGNNFVGSGVGITQIDAANISLGTLSNSRLPQNINISSGIITSLNSSFIGIGTVSGNESIRIYKQFESTSIRLTSETDRSSIILGRNLSNLSKNGVVRYGNNDNLYAGTLPESLDILNYGAGNLNYYNNIGSGTSANFNWIKGYNNFLMTLTSEGKLGIGKTNPSANFDVVGTSSITSDLYVGQNLTIGNNLIISGTFNSSTILGTKIGVSTNLISSSYDFQVGADPTSTNGGTAIKSGNVYIREDIRQVRNINSSGIITASTFDGDGSLITNINADNITSGTLTNVNINTGIITASTFDGDGSLITNINADNIASGTLTNVNINTGIITASTFDGDGSLITNIDADNITSGTLTNVNINTGIITALSFNGVGSSITNINADNIASGTLTNVNINTGTITANTNFVGVGSLITNINADNITLGTLTNVNINTGIITASTFDGNGSLITNINADNIASGTLTNVNINTGIITASTFDGNGLLITNIDADNIASGILDNSRLPSSINLSGIITALNVVAEFIEIGNTLRIQSSSSSSTTTGFGTFVSSPGTPETIDSFEILSDDFKSIEYTLHLENSQNIQVQKVLATQNQNNAYSTGYGVTFNLNRIAITSTVISSGDFELRITPESGISGLTTYRFIRQSLS